MTIIDFLNARLDEDEAAAKAAGSAPWVADLPRSVHVDPKARSENKHAFGKQGYIAGVGNVGAQTHIARHDPARALRQVTVHRTILAIHHPYKAGPYPHACRGCPHSSTDDPYTENINECPELRAIASIHADHPDYLEATTP